MTSYKQLKLRKLQIQCGELQVCYEEGIESYNHVSLSSE